MPTTSRQVGTHHYTLSVLRRALRDVRVVAATFWIIATQLAFAEDKTPPPLTIGAILPLSGGASNFGAIARRGIELALAELTPEDRARVKVVYEDDGLSNARSATAARKLLTIDKVDALLTWSSGTGLTVAGLAEATRIPHMSIASDPAVARGRTYSFTYWPTPEDEAQTLHDHLVARGIKKVALISQVHNGILAVRDAFVQQAAKGAQIAIVANEELAGDTTDFRAVLERIKGKGEFEAFIPIFFPGQLATCIRQARALGITAPLFGFETFDDKDEIKAAGGLMTGAVYATGGDPQADFIKRYEAKYPGESYYTANQAYDIIQLYVTATRERKDSQSIVSFVRSLKNYPTSSGLVSATPSNQFRLPTTLKKINSDGIPENL